jgi:hypothetical protein
MTTYRHSERDSESKTKKTGILNIENIIMKKNFSLIGKNIIRQDGLEKDRTDHK